MNHPLAFEYRLWIGSDNRRLGLRLTVPKIKGAGLDVLEFETQSFNPFSMVMNCPDTQISNACRPCTTKSPCRRLDHGKSCQTGRHHS